MIITAVPPFETPNVQAQITLKPSTKCHIWSRPGQCAAIVVVSRPSSARSGRGNKQTVSISFKQ